ncbi:hypothetical protein [Neisseria wadsworthii]|uniref:Uncharacterized protein n=1 Tax=Neisseria wadsworthii 9715 TaxID=1030841 RepID=G4CSX6_9NEIS|nr:hypothetical protein [Neisseria wadsworthii]EGZ44473.1 hypothetical protein HMPREF9370_2186 [Neisseria wadsworthii 9715]QMT35791.1 hypothetical protein H3L96_00490 [Neisseria wadsworthii]
MLKKITIISLLIGMLSAVSPVYAEIFIVNNPDPNIGGRASQGGQQAVQLQMPQISLSNIDANRIALLQRYQYAQRVPAINRRQQNLQMMSMQIASWMQHGAPERSVTSVREALKQMNSEIQQSMASLEAGLELPELQQLYSIEEQNARTVRDLNNKLNKVRVIARPGGSASGSVMQPAVSTERNTEEKPVFTPQSE